jgi:mono/diheme cytochrome c family protein
VKEVKEGTDGKDGMKTARVGGNELVTGASKRRRKAAMTNTNTRKALVVVLAAFTLGCAPRAGAAGGSGRTAAQEQAGAERQQLLAKGKATFVERCAKCHNEGGDKELSSGKPLSERGLGTEAIAKAVNGRLSKGTEEERRAVTLYIVSLMKTAAKAEARP